MKTKLLFGLLAIVVIVIAIVYFLIPKSIICTNYVLDEEHLITDESKRPQGTWRDMKSPNDGSKLEQIIIDPDDPNIMDEPWRYAYYSKTENIFWVADMPGMSFGGWYGPFEGKPCL